MCSYTLSNRCFATSTMQYNKFPSLSMHIWIVEAAKIVVEVEFKVLLVEFLGGGCYDGME